MLDKGNFSVKEISDRLAELHGEDLGRKITPHWVGYIDSSSPFPHTLPFLRMARKTQPLEILAASHSSIPALIGTSSGIERTF